MKKILALIICFTVLLTFAGCNNDSKKNSSEIDLEYYAKHGSIPELKYSLGYDVTKAEEELSGLLPENGTHPGDDTHDHDKTEFYFERVEGEKNILLDNGTAGYYYNKENKKNGISLMVNYEKSFGFEIGTISVEIRNALKDYKFTEEVVTENNAFFADYIANGTVLKTEIDEVVIMFVFQENELFATAIYDKNNWTF